MDYVYKDEFKQATGMAIEEVYEAVSSLPFSKIYERLVLYEAQVLEEAVFEDGIPYEEKWRPISRPVPDRELVQAIIDWDTSGTQGRIYRVVETTISQRVIWPGDESG